MAEWTDAVASAPMSSSGPSLGKLGGWLVAASAASIVAVSAFYVLSPPAAIDPALDVDPVAAAAAAVEGARTMRLAGLFGVIGDLVLALGALLLMAEAAIERRSSAAAGWGAVALSALVFEIVDALAGFVLPAAGASPEVFLGLRNLYAALFLAGTATFGAGALLLARGEPRLGRLLGGLCVIDGVLAIAAVALVFAGLPLGPLVGGAVGFGALIFVAVGARITRLT
ncbi:hypothetical protein [Methylopila sp. M107]|uniref:hypothetical protein n=1 Tax=Methylopila sp. M107 TaxID=1101190 RepID=UPI0003A4D3B4|nr:hypothetical protein [Methylopila sp. M107]